MKSIWSSALLALLLVLGASTALAAEPPQEGDMLPDVILAAPDLPEDAAYLGLGQEEAFHLADLDRDILFLEIIGVYCPFCHQQAPLFNDLAARLDRAGLDRVKMIAVASGATPQEIAFVRENSGYAYPLLRDQDYSVHRELGEPQTPFTMLVDSEGKVLWTHMGVVEDVDELFNIIKELSQ